MPAPGAPPPSDMSEHLLLPQSRARPGLGVGGARGLPYDGLERSVQSVPMSRPNEVHRKKPDARTCNICHNAWMAYRELFTACAFSSCYFAKLAGPSSGVFQTLRPRDAAVRQPHEVLGHPEVELPPLTNSRALRPSESVAALGGNSVFEFTGPRYFKVLSLNSRTNWSWPKREE